MVGPLLLTKRFRGERIVSGRSQRQSEIIKRTHKRLRADEGMMWLINRDDQEEVLLAVGFDECLRPVRYPVGVRELLRNAVFLNVGRIQYLSRQGPGGIIGQGVQVVPAIKPVFRIPTFGTAAIAKIVRSVQMPLPHIPGCKPLLF